jgi:hypothetical protein
VRQIPGFQSGIFRPAETIDEFKKLGAGFAADHILTSRQMAYIKAEEDFPKIRYRWEDKEDTKGNTLFRGPAMKLTLIRKADNQDQILRAFMNFN